MSTISKFYQVTNFILLEYKTDLYAVINGESSSDTEATDLYMIKTNTGSQMCLDLSNFEYTSFPLSTQNDYYFPGFLNRNGKDYKKFIPNLYLKDGQIVFNNELDNTERKTGGTIINDGEGKLLRHSNCLRDTVRLYFTTGYFMNSLQAISLNISAPVKSTKLTTVLENISTLPYEYKPLNFLRIKDNITLLQYYLPKSKLFNLCKRLASPLYFNSRFYDRYVEITFPSAYDLAYNDRNIDYVKLVKWTNPITKETLDLVYRGFIDKNSPALITFATVSDDFVTYINEAKNELTYLPDAYTKTPITYESNAKYFNVELYEDYETGTIIYQPVYGDEHLGLKMRPFDLDMMNKIEYNIIHVYDTADEDSMNDGMDDFIELYGEDTYKWCIINELSVTYYYDYITESDRANAPLVLPYTEYYTNTIDYTGKTNAHGEFWKSKFMPYIQDRPLMVCNKIGITYTAHLYNRMNTREITRTASMIIKNPMKYNRTIINPSSINTYKVINKIVQNTTDFNTNLLSDKKQSVTKTYTTRYVAVNDFYYKESNDTNIYDADKAVLKLYKGPLQYLIQIFEKDNTGGSSKIPRNLNNLGSKYKLVFPLALKGEQLEFFALSSTDESSSDLSQGKLLFFITADEADRILGFTGDHIFRIELVNNNGMPSTICTGTVKWSNN